MVRESREGFSPSGILAPPRSGDSPPWIHPEGSFALIPCSVARWATLLSFSTRIQRFGFPEWQFYWTVHFFQRQDALHCWTYCVTSRGHEVPKSWGCYLGDPPRPGSSSDLDLNWFSFFDRMRQWLNVISTITTWCVLCAHVMSLCPSRCTFQCYRYLWKALTGVRIFNWHCHWSCWQVRYVHLFYK